MDHLKEISDGLQRGDHGTVAELTQTAVDEGLGASQILNQGLLAGMAVVGEKFGAHEIFLPEVLLAARAMNAGLAVLKPLLVAEEVPTLGRVVIGTVKGDLHDIGKNLVGIMLEGAGFEVIDLGTDVPPEVFVDRAVSDGAGVIGLSALLTTTMINMRSVVEEVHNRGLQGSIKVVVGGAPVTRDFADEIGADGYGYDAHNAVGQIKELTGVA
jgi:5-methyltetrahydrofolate--homocysteine methyltransferase